MFWNRTFLKIHGVHDEEREKYRRGVAKEYTLTKNEESEDGAK